MKKSCKLLLYSYIKPNCEVTFINQENYFHRDCKFFYVFANPTFYKIILVT